MSDLSKLRRALLFMPGDDPKKIAKGAASGVDSVILDLEDGVAPNRKADARRITADSLRTLDFGRSEVLVRINPVSGNLFDDDLTAIGPARPAGIVVPKVEAAFHLQIVDLLLDRIEQEHGWPSRSIRLIGIIESALGLINLRAITEAGAASRLDALAFGAEDYTSSIGATRSAEGVEVLYARSAVVAHTAAFGLGAIDTPFVDLQDGEALNRDARFAAGLGYTGKFAIHPKQIGPIQAAFSPTETQIAGARRLLDANRAHQQDGTGVFELDSRMVDGPMVRAAETVIARARAAGLIAPE